MSDEVDTYILWSDEKGHLLETPYKPLAQFIKEILPEGRAPRDYGELEILEGGKVEDEA